MIPAKVQIEPVFWLIGPIDFRLSVGELTNLWLVVFTYSCIYVCFLLDRITVE